MFRSNNTTLNGLSWSESTKRAVWNKGQVISGYSPEEWRRDICGFPMKWDEHGNRQSEYGWEVDHIYPASKGGSDDLSNLQPLYWKNNAEKGDKLDWTCS